MSEAVQPTRSRNTILAALETFRRLEGPRPLHLFILFLYICENEGLTVTELAELAQSSVASTARLVKVMAGEAPDPRPELHLVEYRSERSDARVKLLYLSNAGRTLMRRLDEIIRRPVLITTA